MTQAYDFIGDPHGCWEELVEMLTKLGYSLDDDLILSHPDNRKLVFVGDLVDRGPGIKNCMDLVINNPTNVLSVRGNHENKLSKFILKNNTKIRGGLEATLEQLEGLTEDEKKAYGEWALNLPPWIELEIDGKPVWVVHACLPKTLDSKSVGIAMYGIPIGYDDKGFPARLDWAQNYKGSAMVIHGHDVIGDKPRLLNNVWNLDTGCVFGGYLTALSLPENKITQVKAKKKYWEKGGKFNE